MRNTIYILAVALAVSLVGPFASRIHIVHMQHFCSNAKCWRVTFGLPDATNLGLASGVYRASSYSLTNGFGLRPPGVSMVAVPFGTNALRVTNRFGP